MKATSSEQEIRDAFERDGFVVLPNFLSSQQIQSLNAEITKHYSPLLAGQDPLAFQPGNFEQFECDVIGWDPCGEGNGAFTELKDSPELSKVTGNCLGAGFTAPGSLVMLATAGGRGQAWHQDCPPETTQNFNLNRLFYTQDVSLQAGAIVVVPGSHRAGKIPPGGNQESIFGEVVLTPQAGTLVLLSGHVYHRVTPNHTRIPRLSVNFRAYPAGVATDVCNTAIYRGGAYDFAAGKVVAALKSER